MHEIESLDEFRSKVSSGRHTLVYFTAAWCGPCKSFSPVMERVAESFSSMLDVVKVDVDKVTQASIDHNIRSVPTVLFLDVDGVAVEGIVGNQSYESVSRWLLTKMLVY